MGVRHVSEVVADFISGSASKSNAQDVQLMIDFDASKEPQKIVVFYCAKHHGILAQALREIAKANEHISVFAPSSREDFGAIYRENVSANFFAFIDVDKNWIDNEYMISTYEDYCRGQVFAFGEPRRDSGHNRSRHLMNKLIGRTSGAWEYQDKISSRELRNAKSRARRKRENPGKEQVRVIKESLIQKLNFILGV